MKDMVNGDSVSKHSASSTESFILDQTNLDRRLSLPTNKKKSSRRSQLVKKLSVMSLLLEGSKEIDFDFSDEFDEFDEFDDDTSFISGKQKPGEQSEGEGEKKKKKRKPRVRNAPTEKLDETCNNYLEGRCRYGDDCRRKHVGDVPQKVEKIDEVCNNFLEGRCRFGEMCRRQHPADQAPAEGGN